MTTLQQLKEKSNKKILLRGESGSGKTHTTSRVIIEALDDDMEVMYVDTESEGSTTIVEMIEQGDYEEEILEGLDYEQIDDFERFMDLISKDNQEGYDILVVDTLDHKHTMALKEVTNAEMASEADWNQYPMIYDVEKSIMELLSKPKCHVIGTIDPDSGKIDKPKGAQVNVHGYFNIVVDLTKSGGEWGNIVRNWVNRGDWVNKEHPELVEALVNELTGGN